MKEKYKAIIKRYYSDDITGEHGEVENSELLRYTCADSLEKAISNIRYHLKNDDDINLDYTYTNGSYSAWYEIEKIAPEKDFEKKGRGKDTKKRHRRTKAEIERDTLTIAKEIRLDKKLEKFVNDYCESMSICFDDYITKLITNEYEQKAEKVEQIAKLKKELEK